MTISAAEVDCVAKAILSERTAGHIDWRGLMEIFKNEYRDQAIAAIGAIEFGAIAEIRTLRNAGVELLDRAEAAEAEVARLKTALRRIADSDTDAEADSDNTLGYTDPSSLIIIARKALEPKP